MRYTFGAGSGDSIIQAPAPANPVARFLLNAPATGTFWSAQTGGTQYTDLVDASTGAAIPGLSTDQYGRIRLFKGPDGVMSGWADFGAGRVFLAAYDGVFTTGDNSVAGYVGAAGSATQVALDSHTDGRYPKKGAALVNVKDSGAKGDGTTDDTAAINAAITANPGRTIFFPAGTYMVNATANSTPGTPAGILLNQPSTKLLLDPGATLQAITNASTNYAVIKVTAADCRIEGGTVRGDVATHTGTTGEWGHCIIADAGSDRLKITGTTATKAWGDGFIIQNGPSDIELHNVTADDNRRQGLSVVSVQTLRVYGGRFRNTGTTAYTAPGAGIDIEPNSATDFNRDLEFHGVSCTGNKGHGAQVIVFSAATSQDGAKFFGGNFSNNQQCGITVPYSSSWSVPNLLLEGVTCSSNTVNGFNVDGSLSNLRIIGGRFNTNQNRGISIIPSTGGVVTDVYIIGATVFNNSQSAANTVDGIRITGTTGVKVAFTRSSGTSQRYGITTDGTVANEMYVGNDVSGNATGSAVYGGPQASRVRIEDGLVYSQSLQSVANTKIGGSLDHLGTTAGFYGTTAIAKQTGTPAAAVDAATTQALVNDLRAKLIALGLIG